MNALLERGENVLANIVAACKPGAQQDAGPSTFVLAMTVLAAKFSTLAREATRAVERTRERIRTPATRDLSAELRAAQARLHERLAQRERGQGMER